MLSRHFRKLWLAALALLVLAQAIHVVEHWSVFTDTPHVHHDHSHGSNSSEPCDTPEEKGHLVEHSHSPAIVEADSFFGTCAAVWSSHPITVTAPEAPVGKIEYPPRVA